MRRREETAGSQSVAGPFGGYRGVNVYTGSADRWSNILARARRTARTSREG